MNSKERMHHSIEHVIDDIVKVQDTVIKLSREIYGLHVAKEHERTLNEMKEQIGELRAQLESMQEFLYVCDSRVEHPGKRMTEIDIAL